MPSASEPPVALAAELEAVPRAVAAGQAALPQRARDRSERERRSVGERAALVERGVAVAAEARPPGRGEAQRVAVVEVAALRPRRRSPRLGGDVAAQLRGQPAAARGDAADVLRG